MKTPPTGPDMAEECARVADRAEYLAKRAKSHAERAGFEKIASEWRTLESVARLQKPTG